MYNFQFRQECFERYLSTCNICNQSVSYREVISIFLPFRRKKVIPFFDFNVNTLCTLKCKKCDQGIPYLNQKNIYDYEELKKYIDEILNKVDYIYQISIIGGEPLINKDLDRIIGYCCESTKIGSIIIVTNGTIMPSEKILAVLKNKKIIVGISWYPLKNIENRDRLINYFEVNEINYHVRRDNWLDFGDWTKKRNYSKKLLKNTFKECFLKNCIQYNKGIMYRCAKQYLLKDKEICQSKEYETVDVCSLSEKDFNKMIKKFYSLKMLSACDYCNQKKDMDSIPLGEQL